MAVEDPGTLLVTCDRCQVQTEMSTTEYKGHPPTWGVSDATFDEHGWFRSHDLTYCPQCEGERHEEGEDEDDSDLEDSDLEDGDEDDSDVM